MTRYAQNMLITLVLLGAAGYFWHQGGKELAVALVGAVILLWRNPGTGAGSLLLLALPGLLCASGCKGQYDVRWPYEGPGAVERVKGEYRAQAALLLADGMEMKPIAAPTCTAGRGCIYTDSTTGLLMTRDAASVGGGSDTLLKLHAAQSFRTSANCAGLAGPVNGDVCFDTGTVGFFYYAAGWTAFPVADSLLLHKAGIETITGVKTFNAAPVIAAGLTASGAVDNDYSGGTGKFKTSSGENDFNGNIVVPTTKTITVGANVLFGSVADKLNAAKMAITSQAIGDLLCADTTSTFTRIAAPALGRTFISQGANTQPIWSTALSVATAGPDATHQNTLPSVNGDTYMLTALGDNAITGTLPKANGGWGQDVSGGLASNQCACTTGGAVTFRSLTVSDFGSGADIFTRHNAGSVAAIGIATAYLVAPGANGSATEVTISVVPRTTTARNLYCIAGTAPGGADTAIFTVRKNAADPAAGLTCTITGAGTTCNDTTRTIAYSAGDKVSIKAVSSGVLAAGLLCSWEEGN